MEKIEVEIIGRVPKVPAMLVEAIKAADPMLVNQIGKECVNQGILKETEKEIIVGAICLIQAEKISREIERLEKENKIPSGLRLQAQNLYQWGFTLLRDNLPKIVDNLPSQF